MRTAFLNNESNFHLIIDEILQFIQKHQGNLLAQRDGGTPCKALEGLTSHSLTYLVCEVYNGKKELLTKVLQFTNGHDNNIASNLSIHVHWGDEVCIEEDMITIIHRVDAGSLHESTLKVFPSKS